MTQRLAHFREQTIGSGVEISGWTAMYKAATLGDLPTALDVIPDTPPIASVFYEGWDHFYPAGFLAYGSLSAGNSLHGFRPTDWPSGTDQQAVTFIFLQNGSSSLPGVAVRMGGGDGSEDFYAAWLGIADTFELVVYSGGVATSLGSVAKTIDHLVGWFVKIEATGTTIRARAWRYDEAEPSTWDISVTDATIASGYAGLVTKNVTASVEALGYPRFLGVDAVSSGDMDAPIPKTRAQLEQFSQGAASQPIYLVELGVLGKLSTSPATALESKVCISTAPFVSSGVDDPAHTAYDDIIVEMPVFKSVAAELFRGRSQQDFGDIVISSENAARDEWLTWSWDGRSADIWVGAVGWKRWDFIKLQSALIESVDATARDRITFRLRDRSSALARKFQSLTISGSTANAGKPKPWFRGKLFNIEPLLEDAAALRYRFDDGGQSDAQITISEVRDAGVAVAATEGTGVNAGTFTLSAAPTGRVTCDIVNTGSVRSHPDLFQDAAYKGGFRFDLYRGLGVGDLLDAANDDGLWAGIYVDKEMTTGAVLDEIAVSYAAFWWFDRVGQIRLARFDEPAAEPHHEILQDDVMSFTLDRLILPSDPEYLYGKKNWTVQADGLAGAVSAADRALYASVGTLGTFTPTYSGLDQPDNHLLKLTPKARVSLYYDQADAVTEGERLHAIRQKIGALFTIEVAEFVPVFGMGETISLTHDRYGFSAGKSGLIVGLEEDYRRGRVRITFFAALDGQFPVTTSPYPIVGEDYFY